MLGLEGKGLELGDLYTDLGESHFGSLNSGLGVALTYTDDGTPTSRSPLSLSP